MVSTPNGWLWNVLNLQEQIDVSEVVYGAVPTPLQEVIDDLDARLTALETP